MLPCLCIAGLPANTINEHLGMLLEAAKTAKSPTYLARNVMELYDRCMLSHGMPCN
jgi:hypothetical protein